MLWITPGQAPSTYLRTRTCSLSTKRFKKKQASIPMFVQRHGRSQNEDPANKLETFAISL